MTSRERVVTAFAHRQPDRVPGGCGPKVPRTRKDDVNVPLIFDGGGKDPNGDGPRFGGVRMQ